MGGQLLLPRSPCAPGSLAFSKLGAWGGQNKPRVPMGSSLAPDPSTIRPSLCFLSWLLEQAGLLEPFLKRNQTVVAQAIFSQLC